MSRTSDIAVPNAFCCPITLDVMVEPVRTDCKGYSTNFFKRIFQSFFSPSSFQGHVFENLALASWLQENDCCPICKNRIQKVTPDREMARNITKQFINVSKQNKAYFQKAKRELGEETLYALETPDRKCFTEDLLCFASFSPIKV